MWQVLGGGIVVVVEVVDFNWFFYDCGLSVLLLFELIIGVNFVVIVVRYGYWEVFVDMVVW